LASLLPFLLKKTFNSIDNDRTGLKLTNIIGLYELECKEVEGNWPDAANGGMHISIFVLPNTKSTLIGTFDLGFLEGTMVVAVDKDSLDHVRHQMTSNNKSKADKSATPTPKVRTVDFTWRGHNTGDDDEVHPGSDGTQTGVLKLKDNECSSLKGVEIFPPMGDGCEF
jgi:hypothetical protein